jgi:hypothetical protein
MLPNLATYIHVNNEKVVMKRNSSMRNKVKQFRLLTRCVFKGERAGEQDRTREKENNDSSLNLEFENVSYATAHGICREMMIGI